MVLVSLKYKVHQTVIQTHGIHVPQMVDDPAFRILSRLCSCIVTVLAVISQADKIMCCPIGRRKGKDSGDPDSLAEMSTTKFTAGSRERERFWAST